ncbi:MAG: rhomboid family intramembrane serine protease [candidate division WOR-3 bacterium]|nr:MAG: rhomboid family intramembrane serine protease [candidate division WOR-3 bacterium]
MMFFIIPIGSEEGVRRLPYVTIGLIVLNTVIWVITSMVLTGQMAELEQLNGRMLEIESYYTYELLATDPNLLNEVDYDKIRERIVDGDIIPVGTEDYQVWKNLYDTYTEKNSQMVFNSFGFTPARFDFIKLFTSVFVHANFLHLLFNMLFLWLVGCNIEDDWSWKVFLGLYLVAGLVAGIFHAIAFPKSEVPLIGASGAIAGIMGAFMIRHFKTKIRFAYFFFFFIRPYFGTFSIYAGIALPIWFVQQIFGASWGMESGTAYWAHIGGFIFGAAMGASFKFFGIEKKYIEPMVEDSFEKLKLSPKMKEANALLDAGNADAAIPVLLQVVGEEKLNHDALLVLARLYYERGKVEDAVAMYDRAMEIALRTENNDLITSIREEMDEKKVLTSLSEKNLYKLGGYLERQGRYEEAAKSYGLHIELHRASSVRPKAIYRVHLLFRDKLSNASMAQNALAYLQKEYPEWLRG